MTATMERHTGTSRWSAEEVSAALYALAMCSGHYKRASKLLAEQDIHVRDHTLRYWATESRVAQYQKIREEVAPKLQAQLADMHGALAKSAGEIEARAVERLREKLEANEIDGKDLSAVMQRAAIATGIHGEKQLLYEGQPTQIIQRNASDILRSLKGKGLEIEVTAEEVPTPQLEAESSSS